MCRLLILGLLSILITVCSCMQPENIRERNKLNLETIYGNQGVPVKFSCDETSTSIGARSVPGFPKSGDGIPYIYCSNSPGQIYNTGTKTYHVINSQESLLQCGRGSEIIKRNTTASIQTNQCKEDERYDENLRKCVKQHEYIVP